MKEKIYWQRKLAHDKSISFSLDNSPEKLRKKTKGKQKYHFSRSSIYNNGRFYNYFSEFTRLVDRSILPSLGRKLLFVFPLTNAELDLTKRKMSNGSANVKHSEAMSDEIITAMSTACDASIFIFELF